MIIKNSVGSINHKNGWYLISISGNPRERGYQYGSLCVKEFVNIQNMLQFYIYESYGIQWTHMIELICNDFYSLIQNKYKEYFEEMKGIADGLIDHGCFTSLDEIIAWNFYMSIPYWLQSVKDTKSYGSLKREGGGAKDKCSAFIAIGKEWTEDGEIVVAHNSFSDFIDGQFSNVLLFVHPTHGFPFVMQTSPCWIWSGTDFFISSRGIIGTETTIGGFLPYLKKIPLFLRIRSAMQYGTCIDDYLSYLIEGNSGDYANSWLFGDIYQNEICRIELGLEYHNIEKKKDGYFIGFNGTYDPRIRNKECIHQGFFDIRRHQGARMVRLEELMMKYKGKLNISIAQKIISDHYDVYLKKQNKCSRTICSHYDLDPREFISDQDRPVPFSPHGALDGIVCNSESAKQMCFYARFGNSCGTPFLVKPYIQKNQQFKMFEPYLFNRPKQNWLYFSQNMMKKTKKISKKKKTKKHTKKNDDE
jgi:hypothetical protein